MKERNMLLIGIIVSVVGVAIFSGIGMYLINMSNRDATKKTVTDDGNKTRKDFADNAKMLKEIKALLPSDLNNKEEILKTLIGENFAEVLENDEARNNLIKSLNNYSIYQLLEEKNKLEELIKTFGKTDIDNVILDEILRLFRTQQYHKVLIVIDKYLTNNENLQSTSISQLLKLKATAYDKMFDFNNAISELEKAIIYDDKNITLYTLLGNIYLSNKDYAKAKKTFLAGITVINENKTLNTKPAALLYIGLAKCHQYLSDYDNAIHFLNKSLTIYEKHVKDYKGESFSLIRLAEVYIYKHEYNKALDINKKADSLLKDLPQNKFRDHDMQYNYGRIYFHLEDYDKAHSSLKDAMQLSIETDGKDNPTIGYLFLARGDIYLAQFKDDEALKDYEKAESLFITHFGENYLGLEDVHNIIGELYERQGKYSLAKDRFEKSLIICLKNNLPNSHIKYVINHANLGRLYMKMKKYELARENLVKSIKINSETFNPNNGWYGQALYYYGNLLLRIDDNAKESINIFLECENIISSNFGTNSPKVADVNGYLGLAYYRLNNFKKAREYWSKALKMYPENHYRINELQARLDQIKNK
jgi:tetratricopeptide (TPR) repeat protein